MDLVIKRLSSIEEASAGIIEAAENEKKALEQQMRERIQAFDEEAEKATQEKLDQIRSSLNEEMQKVLPICRKQLKIRFRQSKMITIRIMKSLLPD